MRLNIHYKITILIISIIAVILAGIYFYLSAHLHSDSYQQAQHQLKDEMLKVFLVSFIFAGVFSFIASTFISTPIKEISAIAQRIASGDFSRKLDVRSNDEIELLAQSLNHMSEQIKVRMSEVTSSKSRLEAVFLSMIEGVVVVDDQGRIILMNQTLRDFLHVESDPVGRKPIEMIRNIEIQEIVDQIIQKKRGFQYKELTLLVPEEKTHLIHAAPVIREGKIDGAVLIFHDITELRQLEKVRRDFVANVSHELRTPVATIKGYAETLLNGALDDKENAADFVKIIHTDAERLAKLINGLLDLSKIESGKLNIQMKKVVVTPLVERVVEALSPQLKEKLIIFRKDIPSNCNHIIADENAATQVFFNLIENAIKYNKPSGKITLTAQEAGSAIEFSLQDTGIGIPSKDLPRIFERFYRVDKAHSRDIGGTGLGLSIVKHLISANNGAIRVESVLTVGSTFTVSFPKA